jgi:hypothetical protein
MPALVDVVGMQNEFQQRLTNLEFELNTAFGELGLDVNCLSPSDILSLSDDVQDLMEKRKEVERDFDHLKDENDELTLGSIIYQGTAPLILNRSMGLISTSQTFEHRSDWALCSVVSQRTGTNRHRYYYDPGDGIVDFYVGDIETIGAGEPFMDTGPRRG